MALVALVEDDDTFRYVLERQLRRAGHETQVFGNGLEVLDVMDGGQRFDALITDLQLPAGTPNGLSLALMAKRRQPELPVVLMTAYSELTEAVTGRLGSLVVKSGDPDQIVEALAAATAEAENDDKED